MELLSLASFLFAITRESLVKGKGQYSLTPCTNLFRPAGSDIVNIIYFYIKEAGSNRRSTVLSLPLQFVFPGLFIAAKAKEPR